MFCKRWKGNTNNGTGDNAKRNKKFAKEMFKLLCNSAKLYEMVLILIKVD